MLFAETLKEALADRAPQPLLSIPATLPQSAWLTTQKELLIQKGERLLTTPIPALSWALFCDYWETGARGPYEEVYFLRRERLLTFSQLCLLDPTCQKWTLGLREAVYAILSEYSWCLPAHYSTAQETPLPFSEYSTQLDLFACETVFALSEVLVLFSERLGEKLSFFTRSEVFRRGLDPFLDRSRIFRFENLPNNWSAVCAGALGGAALHLCSGQALDSLLARALSCMDVYLDSFGADGVCTEGVDYWSYGFGFFAVFAQLLGKATGGKCDLFADEKVAAIAHSQQYFYLSGGATLSFSDGSSQSRYRVGLSCMLWERLSLSLPPAEFAAGLLQDHCHRYCLGIRDILWYHPGAEHFSTPNLHCWLPDAHWLLSTGDKLTLAAKGGHNGESHNHNDVGSLILYKNGVPLLCDLGAGLYNAQYFSSERYSVFVNRSGSHNLPLVGGAEQCPGMDFSAREETAAFLEGEDHFSLELSGCYKVLGLQGLRRTLCHRLKEGVVTVTDHLTTQTPLPLTQVFTSHWPIALEGSRAVFSDGTQKVTLTFSDCTPSVEGTVYRDHSNEERTAWQLLLNYEESRDRVCKVEIQS